MSFISVDRSELKFVISAEQREKLMSQLGPHLRADANADASAYYPIISMYYDNAERDCYWEKVQSVSNRRKLRVRVYGSLDGAQPPTCFIEIKHKQDKRGVKRRIQLPLEDALKIGDGKWPCEAVLKKLRAVDVRTIDEIHKLVHNRGFRPVIVMRYDRQAYAAIDSSSDLRITYDTGITFRVDNLNPLPNDRNFRPENYMLKPGNSVLELKISGCIPYWLSKVVAEAGCILQSHSKYSNALEHGDPVLRSMLAPNWRKPLAVASTNEINVVDISSPQSSAIKAVS